MRDKKSTTEMILNKKKKTNGFAFPNLCANT